MGYLLKKCVYLFLIFVLLFTGARYAWRFLGFKMCANPLYLQTNTVVVKDSTVHVSGFLIKGDPGYVGYIYEVKDDEMYIGLKFNAILGFFDRSSFFDINIGKKPQNVSRIYFSDNENKKLIWSDQS